MNGGATRVKPQALAADWRAAWPEALALWSSYTQLRDPTFFLSAAEAAADGMAHGLAAIRLGDQQVMVNAQQIARKGLQDHALAILAHEIGHHIYVPGNLTDHARMIAAMTRMLSGLPAETAHMVANLYGDLLINDRLHRTAGLDMAAIYRKLHHDSPEALSSQVWRLYCRTYEHLWRLPPDSLSGKWLSEEMDADAMLLARIVRHFARDWLPGARRFATVLYPYLVHDHEIGKATVLAELGMHDTRQAGAGGEGIPDGLVGIDASEISDDDGFDAAIDDPLGEHKQGGQVGDGGEPTEEGGGTPNRQCREPFEYGALLEALGLDVSKHEVTTRYYRERALPHLIPFPKRRAPQTTEPLAEGLAPWEVSEPLEELDLFSTVLQSPSLVPGHTTVKRVYGESPGADPGVVPLDLDIYVDCSGSMPDPSYNISYLALAGAILALSALRAGARVQATLWSSAGVFETSGGFLRDEKRLLGIITGYVSGGTAFPLHLLRDTYAERRAQDPPAHIVVISDDGADTMLRHDEYGQEGAEVCAASLERARGGGTLVLNLSRVVWPAREVLEPMGFKVHAVSKWEDLVAFARAFVRENYGTEARGGNRT